MQPLPYDLQGRIKKARENAKHLDDFLQSACDYCGFLIQDKKRQNEDIEKYRELMKKLNEFDCVKQTMKFLDEIDNVLQISSTNTNAVIDRGRPKAGMKYSS